MEPLLGTAAVANWLGMSREQVWRLWNSGRLSGYRLDRHLRFARCDVEAFLAAHRVGDGPSDERHVVPLEPKRTRRIPPTGYRRI
jgi:excisionase family DNA binding protein